MNAERRVRYARRGLCGAAACAMAAVALWLLCSAGCGSAANSANGEAAAERAPGDAQPKSALGKNVKQVIGGGHAYTATAYLRALPKESVLGFAPPKPDDVEEYRVFVGTQIMLLKSRFVAMAALKGPEVKKLKLDARAGDPAGWLTDQVRTSRPGNAEIIEVSLSSDDREEAEVLLNAVVKAYLTEIAEFEVRQAKLRLDQLSRSMAEHANRVRSRRMDLRDVAEKVGTTDRQALAMRQQSAMESFLMWQKENTRLELELRQAKAELEASKEQPEERAAVDVSESEVDKLATSDPTTVHVLLPLLVHVKKLLLDGQVSTKGATDAPNTANLQRQAQDIQSQVAARREELRQRLRQEKGDALKVEIKARERKVGTANVAYQKAAVELDKQRLALAELGKAVLEVDMLRGEIEKLEGILTTIAEQQELLRMEIERGSRVTLMQSASAPKTSD